MKQTKATNSERAGPGKRKNAAMEDYEMQMRMLEEQNKKRLMMARVPDDRIPVPENHDKYDLWSANSEAASVQDPMLSNCSRTTGVFQLPQPRFQIVYRVGTEGSHTRMYLDGPRWIEGEALAGKFPIHDMQSHLEKSPEICFIVYRDFSVPVSRKKGFDHTLSVPKHNSETIETTTTDLTTAVTKFMGFYGFVADTTDDIGRSDAPGRHSADAGDLTKLLAPYPAFYHATRKAMDQFLESLDHSQKQQFESLLAYIMPYYGYEYNDAEKIIGNGRITKQYFKYLFKPGDVVVQKEDDEARGLLCTSWVTEKPIEDEKGVALGKKVLKIRYTIKARHWDFDGAFSRKTTNLIWKIDESYDSELVIDSLSICPLSCVNENLAAKLRRRGEWIWKCRTKQLVSYHEDVNRRSHYPEDERCMIDMMVYRELHKQDTKRDTSRWISSDCSGTDDLGPEAIKRDELPSSEFLYLLPATIKGFNLKKKKWVDLKVDNLGEVVWNEAAFERLVLEENTKKLIRALVSDQIEPKKSTDLISGKGNGLIMLLHGGPGTGKTLTAESVAEISRKPLYPVTCGDIGTEPEAVENYLESVLHLGKTWGCVVLLDEADVFLEQRSPQDLHRNALVSVFLRVLEYYEGILILTSNRVSTFDEAFKSRIQLAIHYNDLTFYERFKIWENFISRLQDLEGEEIDAADLKDHIKDLVQFEMNGKEIRNAISNARRYTRWERKQQRNPENCKLDYAKIKFIIDTTSKFDDYIKRTERRI
ncbi:P-loop containing nucleoside triphosphate hydrolase protein [Daldinia vernicosa]|uniref:P-loop containing nucleoside triphosphate hydrolase protein n=1 Tax=Daldinia vernicosa TaxID=114800 RepID=UPI0020082E6D|nr:P-loop containing nucleoside triphosphate hydrolase protein [Daldinia vernicosa]KAI0849984.1 P-loop containing nucleoside triphosphate hydrolase protein [Daldinia vernicosa]